MVAYVDVRWRGIQLLWQSWQTRTALQCDVYGGLCFRSSKLLLLCVRAARSTGYSLYVMNGGRDRDQWRPGSPPSSRLCLRVMRL